MSNENEWKEISKIPPPRRVMIELWDDYGEQVISAEVYHYDGTYARISMRHWYIEESLMSFTHWRERSRSPSGEVPE